MDKRNNAYLYITCFIVSIGGLLLGISANVSGASMYFGDFFGLQSGSFQEGLAVSITMLATFIGNFFAGNVSERIGRKKSLILAALLFCFCTLGSALSQTYLFFLISRFIGGLGIGISLLVVPMYIAELAPSDKRGFLVSFNQLNIGVGYLVAYASNTLVNGWFDNPELKWRWMLGLGTLFPIIYLIGLTFVPESPVWTENRSQRKDKEKTALSYQEQGRRLFKRPMRLILFIAFSVAFFQMACGINAVLFYAPKVFDMAGFTPDSSFLQSNLIGICMVVMTLASMTLIDRLGRKPLLIIGSCIMIASLLTVSATFYMSGSPVIILIGLLCMIVGFSISLGPITWILLSEIFPYHVKGLGISLAGVFNGIISFAVTTLFPVEIEHLGAGNTFMIYAIIMVFCLISVSLLYPETKGRNMEELEKELDEASSTNKNDKKKIKDLKAQIKDLSKYKEDEAAFEKEKEKYYEEVVFSDQAPDIQQYKTYYESIDPENAEVLYKQVVEQITYDSQVEDYAKTYSNMKPQEAASIFDTMTDNLGLVADILMNMGTQQRADILGKMDATTAAKLTEIMEPTKKK